MLRFNSRSPFLHLVLIWAAWVVILYGMQQFMVRRFQIARPDDVLAWTAQYTQASSVNFAACGANIYCDTRVAWDSVYYISIATQGYDDPNMAAVQSPTGERITTNYAFPPLYPFLMRLVSFVLKPWGLVPARAAVLAGLSISLLGTLAAMLALYQLADRGQAAGDIRAPFYLLVFPTGFFLAQVYTEGLFVGLAFSSLALMDRKQWLWSACLAALATLTRTVGIGLALALAVALAGEGYKEWQLNRTISRTSVSRLLLVSVPVITFAAWYLSPLGEGFRLVEALAFGRHPFAFGQSWQAWQAALTAAGAGNPQTQVYYVLEVASIIIALSASLVLIRQHVPIAVFSLFVVVVAVTSGMPQSMIRYMVTVPAIYLVLGRLGRHPVIDRAWTLVSLLLMSILLMLFSFDLWVG